MEDRLRWCEETMAIALWAKRQRLRPDGSDPADDANPPLSPAAAKCLRDRIDAYLAKEAAR